MRSRVATTKADRNLTGSLPSSSSFPASRSSLYTMRLGVSLPLMHLGVASMLSTVALGGSILGTVGGSVHDGSAVLSGGSLPGPTVTSLTVAPRSSVDSTVYVQLRLYDRPTVASSSGHVLDLRHDSCAASSGYTASAASVDVSVPPSDTSPSALPGNAALPSPTSEQL